MSENLVTEIKNFCDRENLSFSDDTAYDDNRLEYVLIAKGNGDDAYVVSHNQEKAKT